MKLKNYYSPDFFTQAKKLEFSDVNLENIEDQSLKNKYAFKLKTRE